MFAFSRRSRVALTILAVLIGCAATALIGREMYLKAEYRRALELQSAGQMDRAYESLSKTHGYSDSAERMRLMRQKDPALGYRDAKKAELIEFGSYEQDGNQENGPEPIRWIVLDTIDERLLVLSADCLDLRQYHHLPFEAVTWEDSDLREWMNSEFFTRAFSEDQRSLIAQVELVNDPNSQTGAEGGANTSDRIFALSQTEASIYIADAYERELLGRSSLSRALNPTLVPTDEDGHVDWWLRSPGTYEFTAQYVDREGEPHTPGANVDALYGVRPALWIDISKRGDM